MEDSSEILSALIRIEKKIDETMKLVLELATEKGAVVAMRVERLDRQTQVCPLCHRAIKYESTAHGSDVRRCGCVQPGR